MTAAQPQFHPADIASDRQSSASETRPATSNDAPALAPVRQDERIMAIDTVRGFALLGILLLNILSFGLPLAAELNPTVAGGATA